MFLPYPGATLLIPSGPEHDPDRMHLFVVLTNPFDDRGDGVQRVLLVSLSTVHDHKNHDPACVLEAGEHRFVKHESRRGEQANGRGPQKHISAPRASKR